MELIAAFTLGLMGSLHCVGMCGPLMLAADQGGTNWQRPFSYQTGRLFTYALLGVLLGTFGLGLRTWNAQSILTIVSGVLLIGFAIVKIDPGQLLQRQPAFARFQVNLRRFMGKAIQQQGLKAQFSLGVCNGLIPCGLVYLAVIGAANTGSPLMGAGFMVAFGLGTLPLLTATLVAGRRLTRSSAAALLTRLTPVLMLAVGILLIWRGGSAHLPADFQNFQDLAFPPMCH